MGSDTQLNKFTFLMFHEVSQHCTRFPLFFLSSTTCGELLSVNISTRCSRQIHTLPSASNESFCRTQQCKYTICPRKKVRRMTDLYLDHPALKNQVMTIVWQLCSQNGSTRRKRVLTLLNGWSLFATEDKQCKAWVLRPSHEQRMLRGKWIGFHQQNPESSMCCGCHQLKSERYSPTPRFSGLNVSLAVQHYRLASWVSY